jgi:hypothetical protein
MGLRILPRQEFGRSGVCWCSGFPADPALPVAPEFGCSGSTLRFDVLTGKK